MVPFYTGSPTIHNQVTVNHCLGLVITIRWLFDLLLRSKDTGKCFILSVVLQRYFTLSAPSAVAILSKSIRVQNKDSTRVPFLLQRCRRASQSFPHAFSGLHTSFLGKPQGRTWQTAAATHLPMPVIILHKRKLSLWFHPPPQDLLPFSACNNVESIVYCTSGTQSVSYRLY